MRKKILIIDGELEICRLLKLYLEKNFFSVEIIGNGQTGLMMAQCINYDLILLSDLLPGIDGIHVLKKLRELKSTPVVIISAQDDENVISYFFKSGANNFVLKPFSCKGVVEKVKRLIYI